MPSETPRTTTPQAVKTTVRPSRGTTQYNNTLLVRRRGICVPFYCSSIAGSGPGIRAVGTLQPTAKTPSAQTLQNNDVDMSRYGPIGRLRGLIQTCIPAAFGSTWCSSCAVYGVL